MTSKSAPISLKSAKAIKAALLRAREPSEEGASDDFCMEYRAPNGRQFEVREYDDGHYFMSEMRPMARLARFDEERDTYLYLDEPRLRGIMDDPNAFIASARDMGINAQEIVYSGSGLGLGSIYYDSLDEVAAAVANALDANLWYDSVDRAKLADPDFQAEQRRVQEEQSAAYRAEQQAMHEQAVADEHGLFKGLHSMMGPLSEDAKKDILSYLNDPSEENWNAIYSTMIKGHKTVWQAWLAVDRSAPTSKAGDRWASIPSANTLRTALRAASGVDLEATARNGDDPTGTVVPVRFR